MAQPVCETRGHPAGVGALMDSSTLTLHRALLRQAKGMLSAYETWIGEQQVDAIAEHLKQTRAELIPTTEREKSLDLPLRKV